MQFRQLLNPRHSQNSESNCLVIGEVAQSHDGSLGMAHAFVDAIADAGADAIKFQTHIAAAESSTLEPWRVKFSQQDATRYDYWKRMEWTEEQWHVLKRHAEARNLIFLSSPFSIEAVELLLRIGIRGWKVASGEITNSPLVDRMLETSLPILLSTGMSSLEEIDKVVEKINAKGQPLLIMQCTSAYPCPPERVGLNLIPFFRDRYQTAVGLSDHSGTIYPGLAAATLGVDAIEIHVCLSRQMFGPDIPVSVTTTELRQLVDGVRFIERMNRCPIDKNLLADDMFQLRQTFTQSIVVSRDLPAGTELRQEHLRTRKPGGGIPAARLNDLVGARLLRSKKANDFLHAEDVEVAIQ